MTLRNIAVAVLLVWSTSAFAKVEHARKIHRAGPDAITGEYIVVLADDVLPEQVPERVEQLVTAHRLKAEKVWNSAINGFFVRMTEAQAETLSRHPFVAYVEENASWYQSVTHQTFVNQVTCDPTTSNCAAVADNRLWHLDRSDQQGAAPSGTYAYCTTGSGVTAYVVDSGVSKFHQEFGPSGTRVKLGYNATPDNMPANDPCLGFAELPAGAGFSREQEDYNQEVLISGHGTAVATALGGRRVGVAKNVNIVPVKVIRCDSHAARARDGGRAYTVNETAYRATGATRGQIYRVAVAGTSGSDSTLPPGWGTDQTVQDGGVTWEKIPSGQVAPTDALIDGLNWIIGPDNPNSTAPAVVSLSTYRRINQTGATGPSPSVEDSIASLLAQDIPVVASANNQNGDACDTTPARMSLTHDVVTAGGSMLLNRPWTVDLSDVPGATEANGGGKGLEPAFDATSAVGDARWICGPGDSTPCSNLTPTATADPTGALSTYINFNGGSNAGQCVTLFAPAKNIPVGTLAGSGAYRDPRLEGTFASGTSFSAPIVAGFVARILEASPTLTPSQVRTTLLANSASTLDDDTLDTVDFWGNAIPDTPNEVLQFGDVNITSHPASAVQGSGGTTLSVSAGGTSSVQYQWYAVNTSFDLTTHRRGAHAALSSQAISGATGSTYTAPASTSARGYWVRVTNSCGTADSDIAVVVPAPSAPSNVVATANGANVHVTWTAGSGAERYYIERKTTTGGWTAAGDVAASLQQFTDTPTTADGIVAYRVVSAAGAAFLAPQNLARSAASALDIANVNAYEALTDQVSGVRAQHFVELRSAANALAALAGAAAPFTSTQVTLASLQGTTVEDDAILALRNSINTLRTSPALGLSSVTFVDPAPVGLYIQTEHIEELRVALQ